MAKHKLKIGYGFNVVWSERACNYLIGKPYNYHGTEVIITAARLVRKDPTLIEITFDI